MQAKLAARGRLEGENEFFAATASLKREKVKIYSITTEPISKPL